MSGSEPGAEADKGSGTRSFGRTTLALVGFLLAAWTGIAFLAYDSQATIQCLYLDNQESDHGNCQAALKERFNVGLLRNYTLLKFTKALETNGETDRALTLMREEVQQRPDRHLLHNRLAELLMATGDYDKAANEYVDLLNSNPDSVHYWTNALTSLSYAGRHDEAKKWAMIGNAVHTDSWGWEWVAWTKQQAGDHDAAARDYAIAAALDPTRSVLVTSMGYNYERAGKNDEALAAYDTAIKADPSGVNIRYRLSLNYSMGRKAETRADYALLLSKEDTKENKASYAGFLLDELEVPAAMEVIEPVLAVEPENTTFLDLAIRAEINRYDYAAAKAKIDALEKADPTHFNLPFWRARYDDRIGKDVEAIAAYKSILEQQSSWIDLNEDIGLALLDINLPQASLKWFDAAIAADPKKARYFSNRARAYVMLSISDKALESADQAIALDAKMAMAYVHRAAAFGLRGNTNLAVADYEKAVSLEANNDWIWQDYQRYLNSLGRADQAIAVRKRAEKRK